MRYVSEKQFDFLGVEHRTSKKGNSFQLVVLGDAENYEKEEFFKSDDLQLNGVMQYDKVVATIDVVRNGFNRQTNLIKLEKAKK